MSPVYPKGKMVAMTAEQAQAIDDFRFANRIKSEAEAIRQLIDAGLKALRTSTGVESKNI